MRWGKTSGENGETKPAPGPAETPEPSPTPTPEPTPETAKDLNDKVEGGQAGDVLGKEVEGLELSDDLQGKEEYKWRIFDVDESHIWLISIDYIEIADCPKKGSYAVQEGSEGTCWGNFKDVVNGYPTGAASVDKTLQSLNQKFFTVAPSSTNNNAKAMAYMLDKNIWTAKFIGSGSKDKVDFVIGGPTIEQIVNVNNKKHENNQLELQIDSNNIGYQIRRKGTGSWSDSLTGALRTSDSELVAGTIKSRIMWAASPSTSSDGSVVSVSSVGFVTRTTYTYNCGFRPVVLLKSGVQVKTTEDGYVIM